MGGKPNLTQERRREESNTITTVEYNSSNSIQKEETAAAAVLDKPEKTEPEKIAVPVVSAVRAVPLGEGRRFPPEPVRSWEELVDEMGACDDYLGMVGMRSGLGILFIENKTRILQLFKEHIRLYDKGGGLLFLRDVKQYFANCLCAGSPVCQRFRDTLEAERKQAKKANPYRFETLKDGKRTYQGRPIPDDAPPRPDKESIWSVALHRWGK